MHKFVMAEVTFAYGQREVLHNISLSVLPGEIVSLLGPNGSGKTTLLKILLGLLVPSSGEVRIDGRLIHTMSPKELAQRVAYVPQVHRMPFSFRVREVVAMGRLAHSGLFGRISRRDEELAESALERLHISHLADARYTAISGGERQLTLIARALAQGAHTLIMDEPLNGLDYGNQVHVLEQIVGLAKEGYTFVKTTHFPDHALWMATRVILLRQGRIIANGSPDRVLKSRTVSDLYQAEISLVDVGGGVRVCMPGSVLRAVPVPELHAGRTLCAG